MGVEVTQCMVGRSVPEGGVAAQVQVIIVFIPLVETPVANSGFCCNHHK